MQVLFGSLINTRVLQLKCAMVMYDAFLVSDLIYGSETMIQKGVQRFKIRGAQLDCLRGLLSIKRMDVRISELCGVTKVVDKMIGEGAFLWFDHVERMENDRIAKWI